MIKKNIVEIDADAELKRIHDNLDSFFSQFIAQLEKSKSSIDVSIRTMTHQDIEVETIRVNENAKLCGIVLAAFPFLLAGCAYLFS